MVQGSTHFSFIHDKFARQSSSALHSGGVGSYCSEHLKNGEPIYPRGHEQTTKKHYYNILRKSLTLIVLPAL